MIMSFNNYSMTRPSINDYQNTNTSLPYGTNPNTNVPMVNQQVPLSTANNMPDFNPYDINTTQYGNMGMKSPQDAMPPKRARITHDMSEILLEEFRKNTNPSPDHRKAISQRIGIPERSVRIWFQNRRAKVKKMGKSQSQVGKPDSDSTHSSTHLRVSSIDSSIEVDQGKTIPFDVNKNYSFIHSSSISVDQWQRVKNDNAINTWFKPDIRDLSPLAVESFMQYPLDLCVILDTRSQELSYFFTSKVNGEKILFRIFFYIRDVNSSSLIPSASKNSISKDIHRNIYNSELLLFLNKSPKFAVYFTKSYGGYNGYNNWTISEDFSIEKQVKDAHNGIGGTKIPHKIIGRTEALNYLKMQIDNAAYTSHNTHYAMNPYLPRSSENVYGFNGLHSHTNSMGSAQNANSSGSYTDQYQFHSPSAPSMLNFSMMTKKQPEIEESYPGIQNKVYYSPHSSLPMPPAPGPVGNSMMFVGASKALSAPTSAAYASSNNVPPTPATGPADIYNSFRPYGTSVSSGALRASPDSRISFTGNSPKEQKMN